MTTQTALQLFQAVKVGAINLSHRIVMAPLTRMRSTLPGDVPNDLMVEYYQQRASQGGLIIAEATTISVTGRGYLGAPGIYTNEQVQGWRKITDAVHAKGGLIVLQLWHVGRTSHIDLTGGVAPIGPSEIAYEGVSFTSNGWVPVSPNRALRVDEIPALLEDYRRAAENAKAAGFDGIELHGANGYLLDQFLQDGSNHRTDEYGGSPENRARLPLEVMRTVLSVWDKDRVGIRISPSTQFNGMHDSNPEATFGYFAEQLNHLGIAYLHVVEPRVNGNTEIADGLPAVAAEGLRKIFKSTLLAAGGFDPESAEAIVEAGNADLVVFGRYFISNPDLPERIRLGLPLTPYDRNSFYGGDEHGYTDYPFHK